MICLGLLCVVALVLIPPTDGNGIRAECRLYDAKIDSGKVKVSVSLADNQ